MKRNKFHEPDAASERERIALQIQAVVAPYSADLVRDDPAGWDGYRLRARSLLDGLDAAARPFPDLQGRLSAARSQLCID